MDGILFGLALLGPFFVAAGLWGLFQRKMLKAHGPRAWAFLAIPAIMPLLYFPVLAMAIDARPWSLYAFDPIDFVFLIVDIFGLVFMGLLMFKMFKNYGPKSLLLLIPVAPLAYAHLLLLMLMSCRPEGCGL